VHIERVGLKHKRGDARALEISKRVLEYLEDRGISVIAERELARNLGRADVAADLEELEAVDVLVVVGGDGTLLRTFHEISRIPPVLGINVGSIGFLYDLDERNYRKALESLLKGEFRVDEWRTGIAEFESGEKCEFLNEIAVSNAIHHKMLRFRISKAGSRVGIEGRGDGIIVSTTVGSYAYALSAGGPLLDPNLEALVVVPIAPFSFVMRPLVLGSESRVILEVLSDPAVATIDGLLVRDVAEGERITIRLGGKEFRMVRVDLGEEFLEKLERRLLDRPKRLRETDLLPA